MGQRALPEELRLAFGRCWVAHPLVERDAARFPIGRNRLEKRNQVRRGHDCDRAGVKIRRESHTGERLISAIASTHYPDPFRVDDALGNKVLDSPSQIVLHFVAPLLVSGIEKLFAVAGRGAEVWSEDGIAAICKELSVTIVSIIVAC